MVKESSVDAPALGMSFNVKLDDRREIVMQSHIASDAASADLDALLDKMRHAADRQAAIYMVKALKKSLHMQKKNLQRTKEDLRDVDERNQIIWKAQNKKGAYKRNNEQEAHRNNVLKTQSRFEEEIAEIAAEIAELEKIANADSGANR